MNELKFTVYKWCTYGVFCSLIDRNIPTSILCGLSRKVCRTTISPVCKCTLCCLMPRLYHWNCTVCISVRVVISSTINLQDIIAPDDVIPISARVYVLYTCLPVILSGAFLALNLNFDELIYLSFECALHCG